MNTNPEVYRKAANALRAAVKERNPQRDDTKVPVRYEDLDRAVWLLEDVAFFQQRKREMTNDGA